MSALTITKLQNRRQWAVRPADSKHNGRDTVIGYIKCRSYRSSFDPTTREFHPAVYTTVELHPVAYKSYTAAQLQELSGFIAQLDFIAAMK